MTTTEKVKLVLDPKTWYRGLGEAGSALYTDDERMCCLGFECVRRGYEADVKRGYGLPSECELRIDDRMVFTQDTSGSESICIESTIAGINDDISIPVTREGDLERISKLQPYFDRLGVELVLGEDPPDYNRVAALEEQEHKRDEQDYGDDDGEF